MQNPNKNIMIREPCKLIEILIRNANPVIKIPNEKKTLII